MLRSVCGTCSPLSSLSSDALDRAIVCTVAARDRLAWADQLGRSLRVHAPDTPFVVLVADHARDLPEITADVVLSIDDVLGVEARVWAFLHDERELAYALGPALLRYLARQGSAMTVFLKEESRVVGRLDRLLERASTRAVTLIPHFIDWPEGEHAALRARGVRLAGTYNGGVVAVRGCEEGMAFLDWWVSRVEAACSFAPVLGEHFEQRWLDLALTLFEGVGIERDPGANVGHWNLPERPLMVRDGLVTIGGGPVTIVRFSGFKGTSAVTSYFPEGLSVDDVGDARFLFEDVAAVLADPQWHRPADELYAFGSFSNGVVIPVLARRAFAKDEHRTRFRDPFSCDRGGFAAWLDGGVDGAPSPISRFWMEVWKERPDVREAFPDPTHADAPGFAQWIEDHGVVEYGVPTALAQEQA